MGIPVLFKTLITDYSRVIRPVVKPVDTLFFDLNCLLHPCCAKISSGNETEMIDLIIQTIHQLIELTGASFVYLAIDGPAPKAKMMQQRLRRHKSVLESKPWDTNAITPGTIFMNTLNTRLHQEFSSSSVVISDSTLPGEGEHKILQYIKQHKQKLKHMTTCIYGLDADLIMLALASGIPNIYLLRERTSFNIEQMDCEYLYLDIDCLKSEMCSGFPSQSKTQVIHDIIFICFLLGNDFIKHSPSLNLRYGGLDCLLSMYKSCYQEALSHGKSFYLINPKTQSLIHWSNFQSWIHLLAQNETIRIQDIFSIRKKQHYKYKRIYDNLQKQRKVVPSLTKSSFPVEDIQRHKPIVFMNDEFTIFQSKDWVQSYNLFTKTGSHELIHCNELHCHIHQVCHAYIESIVWTTHYYFKECISQSWYYPYEYAPTLYDLDVFLQQSKRIRVQQDTQICSIKDQLKFIFPYSSYKLSSLLQDEPDPDRKLSDTQYTLLKRYDWECEPRFIE